MRELKANGKTFILDDEGFLADPERWDHDVAREIAKQLEIPNLTDEQLDIVEFLREYHQKFNAFPILRYVCRRVGQSGECLNDEFIDPMKAWKIAGLPKLDGIHFVSFDGTNYRLEECC